MRPDGTDTCEVLLIRHGRSADVVPGSPESVDPPLHDDGHRQAAALDVRLAPKLLAAVYSSPLRRAVDTATPLARRRGMELEVHPALEEVRLGEWSKGELRRRAASGDPAFLAWSRTGRWDGIPGGEGDTAFRGRVTEVISRLATHHSGEAIAVVAHGGTINAYLAEVLGIERSIWMSVENTSISVIHLTTYGPHVVTVNDCHHLFDPVLGPPPLAGHH